MTLNFSFYHSYYTVRITFLTDSNCLIIRIVVGQSKELVSEVSTQRGFFAKIKNDKSFFSSYTYPNSFLSLLFPLVHVRE